MSEIVVDTSKLTQYATRVGDVKSRLSSLDSRITMLYLQAGVSVTGTFLLDDTSSTSSSFKLYECKSYLENVASKFESVESELSGYDPTSFVTPTKSFSYDYGLKNILKSFGKTGSIFGVITGAASATSWDEWTKVGVDAAKTISDISTQYNNYSKISNICGGKTASGYFLRNALGLNAKGYAATSGSFVQRFKGNLTNSSSAYNLKDSFSSLTGGKGTVSAVFAWGGVVLSGVSNYKKNLEEQEETGISTGRVIAETITETAIDTIISYAGTAIVGSAIVAATGVVAAPVVVAVATGAVVAGINAVCEYFTDKSATELISDAVLDSAEKIWTDTKIKAQQISSACESVVEGAKKVGKAVTAKVSSAANWLNNKLFA